MEPSQPFFNFLFENPESRGGTNRSHILNLLIVVVSMEYELAKGMMGYHRSIHAAQDVTTVEAQRGATAQDSRGARAEETSQPPPRRL